MRIFLFSLIALLFFSRHGFAHGGHEHGHHGEPAAPPDAKLKRQLSLIAEKYESVRNIFETKCIICHGGTTERPWYYSLPGARQLMDHDVREASKHLDMSRGYPFKSHDVPLEDLKAIRKATEDQSMPPFRYRMMHWNSALTKADAEQILSWTKIAEEILGGKTE
jgi:hypothetical protein